MNDDFLLTPTDVAEALNCTVPDVLAAIDSGLLVARRQRGWRIAHTDLARFVTESRLTAMELGAPAGFTPSFAGSRPLDDDSVDRGEHN